MSAFFHCGAYRLPLDRPLVMGIVNLTDDSFSGDGCRGNVTAAINRASALIEAGADIVDIGAESTRPGADYLPVDRELDRLLPVVEGLRSARVPVSVDTNKTEVMARVIDAGASMINDIRALTAPGAIELAAKSEVGICLMHMRKDPATMQADPVYDDVVAEVGAFLRRRAAVCEGAGIAAERITIDPGFGFGKTLEHNIALFRALPSLCEWDYPVLVGLSRKTFLGKLTGRAVGDRASVSAAVAMLAAQAGAAILRVHDVAETRDMLQLLDQLGRHSKETRR